MTDWQARAVTAAEGTQTGRIVACALGQEVAAPRFCGKATITSDGFVMCDFIDQHEQFRHGAFVGGVSDLEQNVLRLADHLRLDEAARQELCRKVQEWVETDYRSEPGLFR